MDVPYTRIVEYKHKPNQPTEVYDKPGTVIFKEYSVDDGDPYYPVPNPDNQALYLKYKVRDTLTRAVASSRPTVVEFSS
jgi:UDP-galactopyranose mutase